MRRRCCKTVAANKGDKSALAMPSRFWAKHSGMIRIKSGIPPLCWVSWCITTIAFINWQSSYSQYLYFVMHFCSVRVNSSTSACACAHWQPRPHCGIHPVPNKTHVSNIGQTELFGLSTSTRWKLQLEVCSTETSRSDIPFPTGTKSFSCAVLENELWIIIYYDRIVCNTFLWSWQYDSNASINFRDAFW